MSIRKAVFANKFYPGSSHMLKQSILGFIGNVPNQEIPGKIKAIIVPHAGYLFSGQVAAYGHKLFKKLDEEKKWKVLLMGPDHHVPFSGAAISEYNQWENPFGLVQIGDIRKEIGKSEHIQKLPRVGKEEHSLEIQIPFLQIMIKHFMLYPLYIGGGRPDWLADDLIEFCKKDDVVTVISADLSHYLDYESAKEVDFITSEAIENMNIEKLIEKGESCGKHSILTLLYIAKKLHWGVKMLEYKNSGDSSGDKKRVVGYGAFVFYEKS